MCAFSSWSNKFHLCLKQTSRWGYLLPHHMGLPTLLGRGQTSKGRPLTSPDSWSSPLASPDLQIPKDLISRSKAGAEASGALGEGFHLWFSNMSLPLLFLSSFLQQSLVSHAVPFRKRNVASRPFVFWFFLACPWECVDKEEEVQAGRGTSVMREEEEDRVRSLSRSVDSAPNWGPGAWSLQSSNVFPSIPVLWKISRLRARSCEGNQDLHNDDNAKVHHDFILFLNRRISQ